MSKWNTVEIGIKEISVTVSENLPNGIRNFTEYKM